MKKSFLLLVLACVCSLMHAYDFSVKNPEGYTYYYTYVSKVDKTVAFGYNYSSASSTSTCPFSGDFEIPSTVVYNDVEYTVTEIVSHAFYKSNITSVKIPNTISVIRNGAFSYCKNLKDIDIPESVTQIGSTVFYQCSSLVNAKLGDNTTSIGVSCFNGCENLEQVTLPLNINSIGGEVFADCSSLQEITIPAHTRELGSSVFKNCLNLKDIKLLGERPPLCSTSTFASDDYSKITLYVPNSAYSSYVSVSPWMQFMDIKKFDDTNETESNICKTPQIAFSNKTLTISCETPNAQIHYSYYLSNVGTVASGTELPTVTKKTNAITVIAYATSDTLEQSKTVIRTFPFDATVYDINCDNNVSIADVSALIDVILQEQK